MPFNSTIKAAVLGVSLVVCSTSFNHYEAYEQIDHLKETIRQYESTVENYQGMQKQLIEVVRKQNQCIQILTNQYDIDKRKEITKEEGGSGGHKKSTTSSAVELEMN